MPDVHHRQNYQGENGREPASFGHSDQAGRQASFGHSDQAGRQAEQSKNNYKSKGFQNTPRFHSITMTRNIKQVVTNITMITARPGTKR
jgi:hypothetical protein